MSKKEIYVSVDIEADGPIPGPHSMLSFGAAAFAPDSEEPLSTFSVNLETLPGATGHPDTMRWWKTQPEAWEACRKDTQDPKVAMCDFVEWVSGIEGKPVFVAYPVGFDFMFMYWYMMKFANRSPFSFSAIDIKTFAMAHLKKDFRKTSKKKMPKRWFPDLPHTHVAIEDAIEQGITFLRMLKESRSE